MSDNQFMVDPKVIDGAVDAQHMLRVAEALRRGVEHESLKVKLRELQEWHKRGSAALPAAAKPPRRRHKCRSCSSKDKRIKQLLVMNERQRQITEKVRAIHDQTKRAHEQDMQEARRVADVQRDQEQAKYIRRARRNKRLCANGCGEWVSKHTVSGLCGSCAARKAAARRMAST